MLSRVFLIKQGNCCGHKCLMCPYEKMHSGKAKITVNNHDLNGSLLNWTSSAREIFFMLNSPQLAVN